MNVTVDFTGPGRGVDVVVSPALPIEPSFNEQTRRRVRHGLADVLEWCGIPVGPKPEDPVHTLLVGRTLYVSRELKERLLQVHGWQIETPGNPVLDNRMKP